MKQGIVLEYENVWSARRWILFPIWVLFSGEEVIILGVFLLFIVIYLSRN